MVILLGGGPTMEVGNGNDDDGIGNEAFLQEEEDTEEEEEPIIAGTIGTNIDMGIIQVIIPKFL